MYVYVYVYMYSTVTPKDRKVQYCITTGFDIPIFLGLLYQYDMDLTINDIIWV
jgi:hypothetical protein